MPTAARVTGNPVDLSHKRVLDTILLKLPGVEAGEITGLFAYFTGNKMFACICNGGVGVRLPAAEAANLQFSRDSVVPFLPKGRQSTREWIQINHENSADYEQDLEIFSSSIAFVKAAKG
jgi:hypothetical protein